MFDKGVIPPLKRKHSQLSNTNTQGLRDNILLGQFLEAYLVLDVQQNHVAVLYDFNKRIKVRESYNIEANMSQPDQDMI